MNKTVVASVVAMVLIGAGAIVAAISATRPELADAPAAAPSAQQTAPTDTGTTPKISVAGVPLSPLNAAAEGLTVDEGVTIVNVWAWWCAPCREEMPYLVDLAARHPEWTVVGVHADQAAARGQAFLHELGVDLPSFQDPDNAFAGTLGLPGVIPITLVVRDGVVTDTFIQQLGTPEDVAKVEAAAGKGA